MHERTAELRKARTEDLDESAACCWTTNVGSTAEIASLESSAQAHPESESAIRVWRQADGCVGETKPLTVVVILTLVVRVMVGVECHLDKGH